MLARRVRRDDDLAAPLGQPVAQLAGIIGAVGDQDLRGRDPREDVAEADQIVRLAGRERQGERPARRVGQGMNLGRPSAARSPDGIGEVPPFAPAAERCALMWVLSAEVVPTTPLDPVST